MKILLYILFLIFTLTGSAQTSDYRDSLTGHYNCRRDFTYILGGPSFSNNVTVTVSKIISNDSLILFDDTSSYQWNCLLSVTDTFKNYTGSPGQFAGFYLINNDSIYAGYYHSIGTPAVPVAEKYLCHKTSPLALDENSINPKLIIAQGFGSITIIQPELTVDRVILYSIDGKELVNQTMYTNTTINTEGFTTGIYLLAFYKNNQLIDSKRIVPTY